MTEHPGRPEIASFGRAVDVGFGCVARHSPYLVGKQPCSDGRVFRRVRVYLLTRCARRRDHHTPRVVHQERTTHLESASLEESRVVGYVVCHARLLAEVDAGEPARTGVMEYDITH
jgi:hypothetical protein